MNLFVYLLLLLPIVNSKNVFAKNENGVKRTKFNNENISNLLSNIFKALDGKAVGLNSASLRAQVKSKDDLLRRLYLGYEPPYENADEKRFKKVSSDDHKGHGKCGRKGKKNCKCKHHKRTRTVDGISRL